MIEALVLAAAAQCLPYDAMIGALRDQFSESVQATGMAATGHVMQVIASDAGTWTIIVVDPTGNACIAAHGTGYAEERPRPNL